METITLAEVELTYLELPEKLSFGGEQKTVVHELIGGERVIDCMGGVPAPIEWSGIFTGNLALEMAMYFDGLRKAGKSIPFIFGLLNYTVVIKALHFEAEMHTWVPYKITCDVVRDNTSPVKVLPTDDISSSLSLGSNNASAISQAIGDGGLNVLIDNVKAATDTVSTIASDVQGTIDAVLQPITAAKSEINLLIGSVEATIQNTATFGGILPNVLPTSYATNVLDTISAMTNASNLYDLKATLGNMQSSISSDPGTGKTITVGGTTLYKVAAEQYGDASAWEIIAIANGLTDPVITTITTLVIPPYTGVA